jgi:hypothetical protein
MQEPLTTASESLSSPILRTPSVIDSTGGAKNADEAEAKGNHVKLQDQMATLAGSNGLKVSPSLMPMLATPTTGEVVGPSLSSSGGENLRTQVAILAGRELPDRNNLMPTPNTMDSLPVREGEAYQRALRRGRGEGSERQMSGNLREAVVHNLPTPTTRDHKDGTQPHERDGVTQTDTIARAVFNSGEVSATNWGKFEPAIRRWEQVLGRPAPAPTKPDGKEGAHRLSSKFTEWMMGLDDGWITDIGLSRNDELKACGNGVVPQQAELALRMLLEGIDAPKQGGGVMFPTPTVSDTFTDSLSSTQQKEGSMHSVTLPQAVRMVTSE